MMSTAQAPVDHGEELQDAAAKLDRAAALVEEATRVLNTTKTQCRHCGSDRFRSFTENRAHMRLSEIVPKLKQWAVTLRAPETFPDRRGPVEDDDHEPA